MKQQSIVKQVKTMLQKKHKQVAILLFLLVISFSFTTGCNEVETVEVEKSTEESTEVDLSNVEVTNHEINIVKQGTDVVIDTKNITSNATYYNYEYNGYIIQIFVFKASDGTIRIAFNTCGACNPSPKAYFVQKGDYFECQNCGNTFHIDEVGLTKTVGCSPIAILDENKTIDGDSIIIASSFLETYQDEFESIEIYENNI